MIRSFRCAVAFAVLASAVGLARPALASDADELQKKAIDYLCAHQNEDGSFGEARPGAKPGEIGITALVIKSLADAHPARDHVKDAKNPWEIASEKAVAYLLGKQQADGSFAEEASGLTTYRTALSVMALVAVDKTKHKDAIDKAVKWLEEAQFDEGEKVGPDSPHYGGWGYDKTGKKPDADLSNSQLALAALHEAGVKSDDPVMKRAVEFLSRCQNDSETNKGVTVDGVKLAPKNDGGFYYGPSRATAKQTEEKGEGSVSYESYASMTYAGLVSLCYAGLSKDDGRVKAALGWIKSHYTLEENSGLGVRAPDPKAAQMGLYYYYFTFARALDALGADEVETKDGPRKWAKDLLDALKARQKPDGSWVNEADRWMEGSPTLVTAYCLSAINLAAKHAK